MLLCWNARIVFKILYIQNGRWSSLWKMVFCLMLLWIFFLRELWVISVHFFFAVLKYWKLQAIEFYHVYNEMEVSLLLCIPVLVGSFVVSFLWVECLLVLSTHTRMYLLVHSWFAFCRSSASVWFYRSHFRYLETVFSCVY